MSLHKYPKWLGLHPMIVIGGAGIIAVLYYFIGGAVFYNVAMAIGILAVAYIILRQMLYPWAVQIIEWWKSRKK